LADPSPDQSGIEAREVPARIAVVGAGLAGLRAAGGLDAAGCEVVVFEAADFPGGKAAGLDVEGFSVDRSLQVLSFEDRKLLAWLGELDLGSTLLPMRAVATAQLHEGRIVRAGARSLREIARTPGIGLQDWFRLLRLPRLMQRYAPLLDPDFPERAAALDYRSVADFARLYFGERVFARFASPLATSATLGNEWELSRAAFLLQWHVSRQGSALACLAAAGLHELALAAASRLDVRTRTRVQQIKQRASGEFSLECSAAGGDESLEFDAVVIATSAREAARIAAALVTPAERDFLRQVRSGPLVSLSVAVEHPLTGLPQLVRVPHVEGSPIEVLLLESGAPGGRAPEGCGLVTLSATERFAMRSAAAPDEEVERELRTALSRIHPSAGGSVRFTKLYRNPEGLPRFEVGAYRALARFQRVQADRRSLGRSLYFAGDYLSGPRFEDAIGSGLRAAGALQRDLAGGGA
jgi:protoporphyrinogen oxidase